MTGNDRNHKGGPALIAGLASGQTVVDAARAAGLSERTVRRRLEDARFRQAVADARAALLSRAVCMLADASTEAAQTLRGLLTAESETVRARAAVAILEQARAGIELDDLAERVAALEEQAA